MKDRLLLRRRLRSLICDRSLVTGSEVTLASGRRSTVYFNMKPTLLHPDGIQIIGALIFEEIRNKGVDLIGGLEVGAIPIATSVALISADSLKPVRAFFTRKQAKLYGTKKVIEGLSGDETVKGQRIVVVEDVTTTGGSSLQVCDLLRSQGGEIVEVITVVDRLEGAQQAFSRARIKFKAVFTKSDLLTAGPEEITQSPWSSSDES